MARKKFTRELIPGSIKPGQCIYGSDEMVLILSIYGKDSEIHKAMEKGKAVSDMVAKSIEKRLMTLEYEQILLQEYNEEKDAVIGKGVKFSLKRIEESMANNLRKLEYEKILLQRCKEREALVEESRQP